MTIAALAIAGVLIVGGGEFSHEPTFSFTQEDLVHVDGGPDGMFWLPKFGELHLGDLSGVAVVVPKRGEMVMVTVDCAKHNWRIEAHSELKRASDGKIAIGAPEPVASASDREFSPTKDTWGALIEKVACK